MAKKVKEIKSLKNSSQIAARKNFWKFEISFGQSFLTPL